LRRVPYLQIVLEVRQEDELHELLLNPEDRSEDISLEIGYVGWPARILSWGVVIVPEETDDA
jgi:hypothetical protein